MQRGVASTSRNIEGTTRHVLAETSGMSEAVDALNIAAAATLGNIRRAAQTLATEATREDKSTGLTPRKRSRRMVEDLPPTESRDVLIRRFKSKGVSSVGSETFLAEHLPLPEGEEAGSPAMEGMVVDSPVEGLPSDEENRTEPSPSNSPPGLVKSLASSSSSATSVETVPVAPSIPALRRPTKSALPSMGTLTDSRTSNVVRTRPQRTRRTVAPR